MADVNVLDLVQNAYDNKPADFADTFNALIGQKMTAALNDKKQEIAQSMYDADSETQYTDDELEQALADTDIETEIVDTDNADILDGETDENS